jgi:hypothetical protein
MTKLNKLAAIAGLSVAGLAGQAMADPMCGMNTGEAATDAPVIVGGIHGNAAPGDFSASTDAAKATSIALMQMAASTVAPLITALRTINGTQKPPHKPLPNWWMTQAQLRL